MKFLKTHLAISRGIFGSNDKKLDLSIHAAEAPMPFLKEFLLLLERVGSPYLWHKRPKYNDFQALQTRLNKSTTRFFYIIKDGMKIGYCLVSKSENLPNALLKKRNSTVEIENFGLFPEFTNKGLGSIALQRIFQILLWNDDIVYLTTRSTNHKKVVDFYLKNHMRVVYQESLEDDLLLEYYHAKKFA